MKGLKGTDGCGQAAALSHYRPHHLGAPQSGKGLESWTHACKLTDSLILPIICISHWSRRENCHRCLLAPGLRFEASSPSWVITSLSSKSSTLPIGPRMVDILNVMNHLWIMWLWRSLCLYHQEYSYLAYRSRWCTFGPSFDHHESDKLADVDCALAEVLADRCASSRPYV